MTAFAGLTQEHFNTYSQEKWSSMVHNLARMKTKDVVIGLCSHAETGLEAELEGLQRSTSDEIPNITNQKKVDSQWVYWFRDADQRTNLKSFLEKTPLNQNNIFNIAPQDKHATLAVILRHEELWIGLRLPTGATVDRGNLAAKIEKSWEREKLQELLAELPEGALAGFEDNLQATGSVTLDNLGEQSAPLRSDDKYWSLGIGIPTQDALELGIDLADLVRRWVGALLPIYRFTTWTRDNDFIEVNKKIQEEKAQKRHQARSFSNGDKVRVTAGLFSGEVGIIQSIDTKGKAKVQVGKMSVVVPGEELIPAK